MGKLGSLIASLCLFVLVAVVGYVKVGFKPEPVSPRVGIDKGIEQVKKTNSLKPSEEALLRVQLAVNDYMIRNQMPPPSLAALVPSYFEAVPVNPDTKMPYEYTKTGNTFRIGGSGDSRVRVAASGDGQKGGKTEAGPVKVSARSDGSGDYINPNTIEVDNFVYDPSNKRDPFQPWDLQPTTKLDPNKSPLEQYDIKQLRLTAVLGAADGDRTALVEDSFGKGYTVKVGTRIGNAGGVAASIEPDLVKIIETRVDFNGVEKQELVEMRIQANSLTKSERSGMKKGKMSSLSENNNNRKKKK